MPAREEVLEIFSFEGQSAVVKPKQILVDLVNGDTWPKKAKAHFRFKEAGGTRRFGLGIRC